MRLQRLGVHRAVRVLSGLLPLAILALVGAAGWNYWSRVRAVEVAAADFRESLPDDVAVRAEGFEFTRSEGGRDRFNIHAKIGRAHV